MILRIYLDRPALESDPRFVVSLANQALAQAYISHEMVGLQGDRLAIFSHRFLIKFLQVQTNSEIIMGLRAFGSVVHNHAKLLNSRVVLSQLLKADAQVTARRHILRA